MRALFILFVFISFSYSSSYTFLMDNSNKELELEAKIIESIAKSSLRDEVKIYIPELSKEDKKVYSKYFIISETCEQANFIFVKNIKDVKNICKDNNQLFFTNNYRRLLKDKRYYGAFFWSKSRPNIVFIKNRLKEKKIVLPINYVQFIEDL